MAFSTAIDEKKLIEDLQKESTAHKAFELLMRTFSEPLYWQIRKMVYDHDDANDLLQNVFLKAWNNIHNFRGDAKLSTWLYKIAVNEAINFINREKSRQNISADTDDTSFLLDRLEADDYFDGEKLHEELLKEIAKLPEKQRLVFNMKYFDEMKYEEISDILGTSVGALKASYHHAVKKLTKAFGLAAAAGILFLSSAASALAVPASPDIMRHTQPDGTVIEFKLTGDENHHSMVDLDGRVLSMNQNGWLLPVDEAALRRTVNDENFEDKRKYLLSGSSFPSTGSPKALVILVMFHQQYFSMDDPQNYYFRMLNEEGFSDGAATGSARDFFVANSSGTFTPQFDVYGPVVMRNPIVYYGANDRYGIDLHPEEVVIEALTSLDDKVDFSQYDTDEDGMIDNVYIFYSGFGEQDSGTPNLIWPHSADIIDFELDEDYFFDGKQLNRYAMSNELKYSTKTPDGIGTFVHEFSHVLGLPDLYATTYTNAFTPDRYSTLDRASYNNNGRTPANYSIFERMCLGWSDPVLIDEEGAYSMQPIHESNSGFIIPTEKENEFFLLENRQQQNWDAFIPGHGMLIWHIDFNQNIWDRNTVNNSRLHQYVDIVEADNRQTDISRSADTFPGTSNVLRFGYSTSPSLRSWDGRELGVTEINNIKEDDDGTIRFNIVGTTLSISSPEQSSQNSHIYSRNCSIFNLSDTIAEVYDSTGRQAGHIPAGSSISLPQGIYIVLVGESSVKIINK